jgi:hypothetical protein
MAHRVELAGDRLFACRDCGFVTIMASAADSHWFDTMTPEELAAHEQREKEHRSHSWTSMNGEDWSCFYCDSKTGNGMCPGESPQDPDEFGMLASTTEREADQIIHPDTYEAEAEDPF